MASTVVEEKRPWMKPLMRVLGVVVPLIGGFANMWCLIFYPLEFQFWALLVAFLLGVVGAVLLRSRRAIFVVPIALTLGELLVVCLVTLLFVPNPIGVDDVPFGVVGVAVIGFIIAVFGAWIGTFIVKKWGRNWLR